MRLVLGCLISMLAMLIKADLNIDNYCVNKFDALTIFGGSKYTLHSAVFSPDITKKHYMGVAGRFHHEEFGIDATFWYIKDMYACYMAVMYNFRTTEVDDFKAVAVGVSQAYAFGVK
jgi:hypothetical protein